MIRTRDGKEIVERLEVLDNAKRFYRYTQIAGFPASHYTGMLEIRPKGSGSVVDWCVQFLANNQPDVVVKTRVSTLLKTGLESLKSRFEVAT